MYGNNYNRNNKMTHAFIDERSLGNICIVVTVHRIDPLL